MRSCCCIRWGARVREGSACHATSRRRPARWPDGESVALPYCAAARDRCGRAVGDDRDGLAGRMLRSFEISPRRKGSTPQEVTASRDRPSRCRSRPIGGRGHLRAGSVVAGHEATISRVGTPTRSPCELHSAAAPHHRRGNGGRGRAQTRVRLVRRRKPRRPRTAPWFRLAIRRFLRDLYEDMAEMAHIIRASSLDWRLVRAAYLVNRSPRGPIPSHGPRQPTTWLAHQPSRPRRVPPRPTRH